MTPAGKVQKLRHSFASTFWIANTLELFERLAYYGTMAILVVYLQTKVGLTEEAGTWTGIFSGVIYSLPVIAGVFVDRFGFRKTLMACFLMFGVGYFLICLAGMELGRPLVDVFGRKAYVISVLLLTAIGGSLIKPCIVGTVAITSTPESRTLGFSIYYTLVNLGGAIGPILALQVRQGLGIEFVLLMSSVTSFLLFIGTFLFFREPESYQIPETEKRSFGKVFSDMLLVFRNFKFISFLVIFSGFWIMFWQVFYLFTFYILDVLHYPSFEILETVDAWGIILFTVPMATLVKSWKPIRAIMFGFTLASVSWLIIGLNGTIFASIVGVGVYALGEATQTPRFYEYVSGLAPRGQVGTFMGFAFLPVAIGSFAAGFVADWLRISYLHTDPEKMWFIVTGIGLLSTVLMLIYNSIFGRQTANE
jgi:POT family proton-dependent oligopeptide transporter